MWKLLLIVCLVFVNNEVMAYELWDLDIGWYFR